MAKAPYSIQYVRTIPAAQIGVLCAHLYINPYHVGIGFFATLHFMTTRLRTAFNHALTLSLSALVLVYAATPRFALAQASSSQAGQVPTRALIDEYVQKTGLDRQLDALATSVPAQMDADLSAAPEMAPERIKRVVEAAQRVFNAKRMQELICAQLAQSARADDLRAFNEFFDTSLGKRVVSLEVAAAKANPEQTQAKAAELSQVFEEKQPARYAIAKRLETATRGTEFVVSMIENMSLSALRGSAATSGKNRTFEIDKARQQFRDDNGRLLEQLRPIMIASSAVMYEALPDDEFSRYVQLLETPAGGRISAAVLRAFNAIFNQLGEEMGKALTAKTA
jgi:hypothetical protein